MDETMAVDLIYHLPPEIENNSICVNIFSDVILTRESVQTHLIFLVLITLNVILHNHQFCNPYQFKATGKQM